MKKPFQKAAARIAALTVSLMMIAPCLGAQAAATTGVTTDRVNFRKSASTASQSYGILDEGSVVTIQGHEGAWYKVTVNGRTGYIHGDYINTKSVGGSLKRGSSGSDVKTVQQTLQQLGYLSGSVDGVFGALTDQAVRAYQKAKGLTVDGIVGPTTWGKLTASSGGSVSANTGSLRLNDRGDAVKKLQRALKDNGYLSDSVDGVFGPNTEKAVRAFQKQQGIAVDGVAGSVTQGRLYNLDNKTSSSSTTLRHGSKGSDVKKLQQALKDLGFYKGSVDGVYGNGTQEAVRVFQLKKGLTADGIAGSKTLTKLYSGSTSSGSGSGNSSSNGGSSSAPNGVELVKWSTVRGILPTGVPLSIYDVRTGTTYRVQSFSNGNHADVEPCTKADTNTLKSLYGGSWSWNPRPVWVTFNGRTIAASIHGMPHGGQTIYDNGMDGQICLHFLGSSTHNGNSSYTQQHQNAVQEAWNAANR